jgi:Ca2+-transporting ATPase
MALAATIGLQVGVVYVPFLQSALHTVPLGWGDWGRMVLVALPIFLGMEAVKWARWRHLHSSPSHLG